MLRLGIKLDGEVVDIFPCLEKTVFQTFFSDLRAVVLEQFERRLQLCLRVLVIMPCEVNLQAPAMSVKTFPDDPPLFTDPHALVVTLQCPLQIADSSVKAPQAQQRESPDVLTQRYVTHPIADRQTFRKLLKSLMVMAKLLVNGAKVTISATDEAGCPFPPPDAPLPFHKPHS